MNFFRLHRKIRRSVRAHGDGHINKMPTEATQLLYSALHVLNGKNTKWLEKAPWKKDGSGRGYKLLTPGAPLQTWVRTSLENFKECLKYAKELCKEFYRRYHHRHFCEHHVKWISKNIPTGFPKVGRTPIPLIIKVTPVRYESDIDKVVEIYRNFYRNDKAGRIVYVRSKAPSWFKPDN